MNKTRSFLLKSSILLIIGSIFLLSEHTNAQERLGERLDHREDFEMESVSGGDFRSYVSDHITEEDRWAYSMQTLGNFHNLMHEMMSHIARHGLTHSWKWNRRAAKPRIEL